MSYVLSFGKYISTTLKSRFIRRELISKGLEYAVKKYPKVGGKCLISADDVQKIILNKLITDSPFMVGRFGGVELSNVAKVITGLNYKKEESLNTLCNNAGFFPREEKQVERFAEVMIDAMTYCDIQGVWYLPYEDMFVKEYLKTDCKITEGRYLEPWFSNKPWTEGLKDKNVLVIHPFAQSIKKQYEKRNLIFSSDNSYLPSFNLLVLKAVQTIAGTKDERFKTWFDALDYMTDEALKKPFDVAIIGCGAYGYPLASRIKAAGKQAIHLGGVTQILFGIKGKRWEEDKNPIVRNMFNEHWVRPSESEVPKTNFNVENGCYW